MQPPLNGRAAADEVTQPAREKAGARVDAQSDEDEKGPQDEEQEVTTSALLWTGNLVLH
ncbi:hypothetical protein [Nonomuraea africana]|uniref:Uncharacterized protein n=1 Tax=Nonomuraea africana TaxID=46171 RepID=A0ABR9KBY2_9ACTN|nr:hypothetical protein [Nonomuraea africana]MBE1559062.1 hypothetical protein [Nonomuraea africana]